MVRAGRRARACGWLELGCGEALLRRLLMVLAGGDVWVCEVPCGEGTGLALGLA